MAKVAGMVEVMDMREEADMTEVVELMDVVDMVGMVSTLFADLDCRQEKYTGIVHTFASRPLLSHKRDFPLGHQAICSSVSFPSRFCLLKIL